jgi:hypothetical protein
LFAHTIELALVPLYCVGGDMLEDGGTTQCAAEFRLSHESVGFALADAKLGDVPLHVRLVMVVVLFVVELRTARRLEIVNPGEPVLVDELGVEAKSNE